MWGMILTVLLGLFCAYLVYRQAKSRGEWAWSRFFGLIGAIVVFFCVFMYPVMASGLTKKHPDLASWVLFGGILIFVGVFRYLFIKHPVKSS